MPKIVEQKKGFVSSTYALLATNTLNHKLDGFSRIKETQAPNGVANAITSKTNGQIDVIAQTAGGTTNNYTYSQDSDRKLSAVSVNGNDSTFAYDTEQRFASETVNGKVIDYSNNFAEPTNSASRDVAPVSFASDTIYSLKSTFNNISIFSYIPIISYIYGVF